MQAQIHKNAHHILFFYDISIQFCQQVELQDF